MSGVASTISPCDVTSKLNDDCWIGVLSYLDVKCQLKLASVNLRMEGLFKQYARKYYRHIDSKMTSNLNDTEMHQLLAWVGEHVHSYSSSLERKADGEQHMWLLRIYCPNLRKLQMLFRRERWEDLTRLKNLESLHAHLHFRDWQVYENFVSCLQRLPKLKSLNLEAQLYHGRGLCQLDQLESLEIGAYSGFGADELADCCITMKNLRHLNIGHYIHMQNSEHFRIIRDNCRQLERLAFGVRLLKADVTYEMVCDLPKLQHLLLWIKGDVRDEFLLGLIDKVETTHPPESLVLVGPKLHVDQVKLICHISSLRELVVSCDTVPLDHLLKLRSLEYLHISMPDITNDQLLALIEGLPLLSILNVRRCPLITEDFVVEARTWLGQHGKQRRKIQVYVQGAAVNWERLREANQAAGGTQSIEVLNQTLTEPILIKWDLIKRN